MGSALAPQHLVLGGTIDHGKYRIIRQLGAGGMGAVYEAENTLTRKRVAIKCLHAARADSAESTARLLREAEAASRIRHPHVVDVYDVGRDGESVFLVMEYLEGEPLSHLLARGGSSIHALIALLLPALRAVAEAHRQGVVHRDIKPDNIFLAREADAQQPVPKVLDFGISKLSDPTDERTPLTLSGSTLGTPRYMPYEQLMGDKAIDGRVDVYAFGVILYEALTGQAPFDAETYPELILKIANGLFAPPKQLRPELPSTLDRLVCWALERDRAQRIPSIAQFIRELEPFATERGLLTELEIAEPTSTQLAATTPSSKIHKKQLTGPAERSAPSAAKRWWLALALGLTLGTVLWWASRSREEQEQAATSQVPASASAVAEAGARGASPTDTDQQGKTAVAQEAGRAAPPNATLDAPAAPSEPARNSAEPAAPGSATLTPSQRPADNRDKRRTPKLVPAVPVARPDSAPVDTTASPAPTQPTTEEPRPTAPPRERAIPSSFRVQLPQSEEF